MYDCGNKVKGKATLAVTKKGNFILAIGGFWNVDLNATIKNINVKIDSTSVTFNNLAFQRFTIQSKSSGNFELISRSLSITQSPNGSPMSIRSSR